MKSKRIAMINQRYGEEVNDGQNKRKLKSRILFKVGHISKKKAGFAFSDSLGA